MFPKRFRQEALQFYQNRCGICAQLFESRYLQIDHRVPYQVAGDVEKGEADLGVYMLLCGSCNRAKSWSCEHCRNWTEDHDANVCRACYWASPENYKHVALRDARRLNLTWLGAEIKSYDRLRQNARRTGERIPEYVKRVLRKIKPES